MLAISLSSSDAVRKDRVVKPLGAGPSVLPRVIHALGIYQRVIRDLVIATRTIADRLAADTPHVLPWAKLRANMFGSNLPDIDKRIQVGPHVNTSFTPQIRFQLLTCWCVNPRAYHGDGDPIRLVASESQANPLTAR